MKNIYIQKLGILLPVSTLHTKYKIINDSDVLQNIFLKARLHVRMSMCTNIVAIPIDSLNIFKRAIIYLYLACP